MSDTPRTEYLAMRLKKSSVEVSDHDLGVQMRIAASELNNLERDLAEAVRLLEGLNRCLSNPPEGFMEGLADQRARLRWYKKMMIDRDAARAFLTSLKERT